MRRVLLAVALLGIVAATVGFRADSSSTVSLSQVRVCGTGSFSSGAARCITDERAGFTSDVLHCSARAQGLTGATYRGAFSFEGKRFPARTGVVPGDGWIYTTLSLPSGVFPAGRWTCTIDAGDTTATVGFHTGGDVGAVTGMAACPTARTLAAGGARACRADLSGTRFAATSRVTCSAVYSLSAGHTASARLLYRGRDTGLTLKRKLSLPVSVLGMQVSRKGSLPAGDYACAFSLDGRRLGTRTFSIAPVASVPSTR